MKFGLGPRVATGTAITGNSNSLFVYGTLMSQDVIRTLIDRVPNYKSARLVSPTPSSSSSSSPSTRQIYRRYPVRNVLYPGLILVGDNNDHNNNNDEEESKPIVEGIYYSDVTDLELQKLDYFEDVEYTKYPCHIQLLQIDNNDHDNNVKKWSDAIIETQVYLWTDPIEKLNLQQNDWSYSNFVTNHLEYYLENTVRPCRSKLNELHK